MSGEQGTEHGTETRPRATTRMGLWRWRNNPMRRHDDVVEAWVVLVVWALIVVGGTVAGVVAANAADENFARQRASRVPVSAVLLADVPKTASSDSGVGTSRALADIRWTAPDGSTRTDRTLVEAGQKAGTEVTVWTDTLGNLRTEPPSPTEATVEAGALGGMAALALGGVVFAAGTVTRRWLDGRRIERWGQEWELVGPQWGHTAH